MKIIIVTGIGEFIMEVSPNEPVLEIKQRIEHHLHVPISNQYLSFFGIELIDGLDMEDYPLVFEGTRIELTTTSTQVPTFQTTPDPQEKLIITVKFPTRKLTVEVDKTETVKTLKEKIHIIDGTPIKRLTLLFSGIEMKEEYRFISEYGICDQSEVKVVHKSTSSQRAEPTSRIVSFMVQTTASLMNGAIIPLEMKDITTVNELRKMMLDEKILPRDDYFFIHKQRIMQDQCSLRWHGVENSDFLYVFKGTISRES
ncbi:hypothetical protein ACHQM5_003702 [Ranunculus cassubicifolius]